MCQVAIAIVSIGGRRTRSCSDLGQAVILVIVVQGGLTGCICFCCQAIEGIIGLGLALAKWVDQFFQIAIWIIGIGFFPLAIDGPFGQLSN